MQGYLEKARRKPEMFPAERIAAIFGNVADIYEFSRTLLADLQKHVVSDEPELSQIGSCFIRHVSSASFSDLGGFVAQRSGRWTYDQEIVGTWFDSRSGRYQVASTV